MGCISSRHRSIWCLILNNSLSKFSNSKAGMMWAKITPIKKAFIIGIFTIVLYLLVVVVTTPALPPLDAIRAAFQINSIIIIGMGIGIGLQIYLAEKSKLFGCKLNVKKKAFGGNSGSTAATSFFSFFSLVPLGCCGWWLYALSLLPSILGTGVSAVLIEYSQVLAYMGLGIIFGFNALTVMKLHKEKKQRSLSELN